MALCAYEPKITAAPPASGTATTTPANERVFMAKGVVKELKPDGKTAVISHEEVPGFMPAMTMPFTVKEAKDWTTLRVGDTVSFRMVVTDADGWIDRVTVLATAEMAAAAKYHENFTLPAVEPLEIGDAIPNYHFTNELGQAVQLSQFKGQAVAITFVFTRCPWPTFCPRISNNFGDVAEKLRALAGGPTNWRLLSISFDTDHDTPAVLLAYAKQHNYDPKRWSFLTGEWLDTLAMGAQFGLQVARNATGFDHNLRTIVVNAQGKIQKVFTGNEWKVDDLVAELVKATR